MWSGNGSQINLKPELLLSIQSVYPSPNCMHRFTWRWHQKPVPGEWWLHGPPAWGQGLKHPASPRALWIYRSPHFLNQKAQQVTAGATNGRWVGQQRTLGFFVVKIKKRPCTKKKIKKEWQHRETLLYVGNYQIVAKTSTKWQFI